MRKLLFSKTQLLLLIQREIPQMYNYLKFIDYKIRLIKDLQEFVNMFDQIIASDFKISGIEPC